MISRLVRAELEYKAQSIVSSDRGLDPEILYVRLVSYCVNKFYPNLDRSELDEIKTMSQKALGGK